MKLRVWLLAGCLISGCGVPAAGNEQQSQATSDGPLIERLGLKKGKWVSQVAVGTVNMDSNKGSIELKPDAPVETVEDCLSDETIQHSDLFLPGIHFSGGGSCTDSTAIAGGSVNVSLNCAAPDKSFGAKVKYQGSYSPDRVEGEFGMDGFHKESNGKINMGAKVISRYVGVCT